MNTALTFPARRRSKRRPATYSFTPPICSTPRGVGRGGRVRRTIYFGTFGIDPYMHEYQASDTLVKLQMQYMFRGIQLRRKMAYSQAEQPFAWKGSAAWQVDLDEADHVEWGVPSARPY